MTYLYGDATVFPLQENFIETITAVTDTCVALFELDEELKDRRFKVSDLTAASEQELRQLDDLAKVITTQLAPFTQEGAMRPMAQATARQLAQSVTNMVAQARRTVLQNRDAELLRTMGNDKEARLMGALQAFLVSHQLPNTRWQLRWIAGAEESNPPELALAAKAPCGLGMGFYAQVPAGSRWLGPVRIDSLAPGLQLELQRKGGWLRKNRMAYQEVGQFMITRVDLSPNHASFEIKKHPYKPSLGYTISMKEKERDEPIVQQVDPESETQNETLELTGEMIVKLRELWALIEAEMDVMKQYRTSLEKARLGDKDVIELDDPEEIAITILNSLAPLIREIRMRSRVPGELVLKRDLGDGRREELFVPRKVIEDKYASLSDQHRSFFSAMGLGVDTTTEFLREAPRSLPPPPPGAGAAHDHLLTGRAKSPKSSDAAA